MKRTIDTQLLRRLRTEKGWSQEELAVAADLSTRTVQRLESVGAGSTASIKSLAAALEVSLHNLEEQPRTALVGVRWGYGGVAAGAICAASAVLADWQLGDGSSYEAGVSLGLVGLIVGLSCAFIGWASGSQ